jgi:hypothetical protein
MRIQEELERKRREEEEARRAEEELRRRELDAKLKAEEEARLAEEIVEVNPWREMYDDRLQTSVTKFLERKKWEVFVECSTLPHPTKEAEITSYITLISERSFSTFDETIEKCQEIE